MLKKLKRKIHRVNFRTWTRLEDLREGFARAAADKLEEFPQRFYAYLSAALDIKEEELHSLPWYECVELLNEINLVNFPSSILPIVTDTNQKIQPAKPEWDYPGRTWYLYSHMLAKTYGWSLEYIGELEIENALALVQEILTDDQLEKEFLWGMSEIAYPYNKHTKESKFQPLPRPYWMLPAPKPVPKVRIPKSLMPQGLIINVGQPNNRQDVETL